MLLDRTRTTDLPFDIMPYRAVLYTSDVAGIAKLRIELRGLASGVAATSLEHRDSPVHDAVSILPVDVLASASGMADYALSEELAALRTRLREYETRFGVTPEGSAEEHSSPLDVVIDAFGRAERGELPTDLVKQAEAAASQQDTRTFLDRVLKLLSQPGTSLETSSDYSRLAQGARRLGLIEVANAVYEAGVAARPHDDSLRASYLGELAHSPDARARDRARGELLTTCGLSFSAEGDLEIPGPLPDGRSLNRIGVMLDAYHADRLHEEALRITTALVERLPTASAIVRNHARALKEVGADQAEVTAWYRRGILCPDVDDTSAKWFGGHMFNNEHYVDAMEAYLLAAKLDPDNATAFVDLLHSAAYARRRHLTSSSSDTRAMPPEVESEFFAAMLVAAFSCPVVTQRDHDNLLKHAQLAEIPPSVVNTAAAQIAGPTKAMGFQERYELAQQYYGLLQSNLTQLGPDE